MENSETAVQAAKTDRTLRGFIKFAGKHGWDFAKRVWRLEAVKSMALTWAIRVSPLGGAVVVGIIDSYMGGS
ncbi:hypothetical protein [Sphingomonas sp. Ag1]|jgi:hypothetical protein|uniref:hypothetical protein n=1 Tax=Sphingomonas sp. Ag1 TaxID=1642949 RepID=UPI00062211AD|nr:hypothetical protein [Sphingomonas sp. Ag1]KKI21336.1 hypothetical protein XM50_02920 [Sphingomonas sp. Ag1]